MYLPACFTPNRIRAMLHLKRYDFFEFNLLGNSRREIERHNLSGAIRATIQFVAVKDVDGFLGNRGRSCLG